MRVLIPLAAYGFDPSETAIPWKLLSKHGHEVVFATPEGKVAAADARMVYGTGLGILKKLLRAREDAVADYHEMERSPAFVHPIEYSTIKEKDFDALLLPGGHDKGVKEYLESSVLQQTVVDFFNAKKPVAAICHGIILVARSIDPATKESVIHQYKTTALLKSQELTAYNMTRFWLKDYYLTYPKHTVQDEVTAALADKHNFIPGPKPLFRDRINNIERGFAVRDRNYLSARWPGDAYRFSLELLKML
jgi:putative intracellular protease/amidase